MVVLGHRGMEPTGGAVFVVDVIWFTLRSKGLLPTFRQGDGIHGLIGCCILLLLLQVKRLGVRVRRHREVVLWVDLAVAHTNSFPWVLPSSSLGIVARRENNSRESHLSEMISYHEHTQANPIPLQTTLLSKVSGSLIIT